MSEAERFETAKNFFLHGLDCLDREQFPQAEEMFLESLKLIPGRPSTLVNLSVVQLKLGKIDAARNHVEKALALSPDDPTALNQLAEVLIEQARLLDALELLDRCLAIDPALPEPHYNRGLPTLLCTTVSKTGSHPTTSR